MWVRNIIDFFLGLNIDIDQINEKQCSLEGLIAVSAIVDKARHFSKPFHKMKK